ASSCRIFKDVRESGSAGLTDVDDGGRIRRHLGARQRGPLGPGEVEYRKFRKPELRAVRNCLNLPSRRTANYGLRKQMFLLLYVRHRPLRNFCGQLRRLFWVKHITVELVRLLLRCA